MSKYGVSERLQGMMCTEPVIPSKSSSADEAPKPGPSSTPSSPGTQHAPSTLRLRNAASKSLDQPRARIDDLESGTGFEKIEDPEEIQRMASFRDLTFAQVTNQIWHFCSVDHGPKCTLYTSRLLVSMSALLICYTNIDTCIGYNSLHTVRDVPIFNGKNLPDGKRLWSWLILFDDGMILGETHSRGMQMAFADMTWL